MQRKQLSTNAIVIAALCIGINLVGGWIVQSLNISFIYLDTIGTIFAAVMFGPFIGGSVGLATNLILGVTISWVNIPFGIVNLAIGVVVGLIAKKWKFNLVTSILTGLALAVLAPLIGSPIAVAVYGGLTGGVADVLFLWLVKTGQKVFAAAFITRVVSNLIDKVGSCALVFLIIRSLPLDILKKSTTKVASN